ncbi:hypothetical protein PV10_00477 [Exophiala mesophila]|uniref:Uncharacterized protein n=1 Tax=Exophiala mesophila TaxID=212818 RepID=A0A0D1ZRQ7_EXOME|nr:uncharacterized protein PV10_00477 [Exophiala mesophila]KIV96639.1 hypothetical protein PV10_00477 [Exophiala mesophila]
MTTPSRHLTRRTVKEGLDTLDPIRDDPDKPDKDQQAVPQDTRRASTTQPENPPATTEDPPKTPAAKKATPRAKTPRVTRSHTPTTARTAKTTRVRKATPAQEKSPRRLPKITESDESFEPDPEPKKKRRSQDPTYKPSKVESQDSEDVQKTKTDKTNQRKKGRSSTPKRPLPAQATTDHGDDNTTRQQSVMESIEHDEPDATPDHPTHSHRSKNTPNDPEDDDSASEPMDTEDSDAFDLPSLPPRPRRPRPDQWFHRQAEFENLGGEVPLKSALKRPAEERGEEPREPKSKKVRVTTPLKSPEWQRVYLSPDPLSSATDSLFGEILSTPRRLEIAHIGALFVQLQEDTQRLAQKHFYYDLTEEEEKAWPLELLKWHHKALMKSAAFLVDGDKIGWRNLFTKKEHRIPLIMAIIAHMLNEQIFKHTAFSFTETTGLDQLQYIDEKYIHYDAFIRGKHRANLLADLMARRSFPVDHQEGLITASQALVNSIYALLEPLLPPHLFSPSRSKTTNTLDLRRPWWQDPTGRLNKLDAYEHERASFYRQEILFDLKSLVQKSVALHLCIRLTASDGTVIKITRNPGKGSPYVEDGPQILVNSQWCQSEPRDTHEELIVKMNCWPRVEAYVPHGLNLEEYEQAYKHHLESGVRGGSSDENSFKDLEDWFESYRSELPFLPPELQTDPETGVPAPVTPGTEWDYRLALQAARSGSSKPRDDEDPPTDFTTKHPNSGPQRGSYVTYYPAIAPARVYCNWDVPDRLTQPLDAAVDEIRQSSIRFSIEDFAINNINGASYMIYRSGFDEQWPWWVGSALIALTWYLYPAGGSAQLRKDVVEKLLWMPGGMRALKAASRGVDSIRQYVENEQQTMESLRHVVLHPSTVGAAVIKSATGATDSAAAKMSQSAMSVTLNLADLASRSTKKNVSRASKSVR